MDMRPAPELGAVHGRSSGRKGSPLRLDPRPGTAAVDGDVFRAPGSSTAIAFQRLPTSGQLWQSATYGFQTRVSRAGCAPVTVDDVVAIPRPDARRPAANASTSRVNSLPRQGCRRTAPRRRAGRCGSGTTACARRAHTPRSVTLGDSCGVSSTNERVGDSRERVTSSTRRPSDGLQLGFSRLASGERLGKSSVEDGDSVAFAATPLGQPAGRIEVRMVRVRTKRGHRPP